jgi:RHS repeat-associated protein
MHIRRVLKSSFALALFVGSATLFAAAVTNNAPVIDSAPYPVAEVGQHYKYAIHATDADGNAVEYSVQSGPDGMAYSEDAKAALWTPALSQAGVQQVRVRARDSWGAYTEQQFALRTVGDFCELYPITVPLTLVANARSGDSLGIISRGTGAGNFSWLSWAGKVDPNTLAASLVSPGDSFNYVNPDNAGDHLLEIADWAQGATGSMNASVVRARLDALKNRDIVVPAWSEVRGQGSDFDYHVAKFATVRLKAYDLTGQGWLSFEFRGFKNCYNDAPVASSLSVSTLEDHAASVALVATDPDSDALSIQVLQQPAHGTLTGSGPTFTYTPSADYFGPDAFTYIASDGELQSEVATVSIAVAAVNDAPVAIDQQVQTAEDVAVPIQLQASDVDDSSLGFTIGRAPAHGSLSGSGAALTYLPDPNFYGSDSFTYQASDGVAIATAVVTITVVESNDPPIARNLELATPAGEPLQVVLSGADPDGDALAYRIASAPDHGSLTGVAPNLVYTAPTSFSGVTSFTYVVSDGRLSSAVATVTIQVTGANHPPEITTLPAAFVNERALFGYDTDAVDPDEGDVLTYRLQKLLAGASVQPATGLLNWMPEATLTGGVRELDKACRKPAVDGGLDPVLQWDFTTPTSYPMYDQSMSIPLVGQLSDDNGDGRVDDKDNPDVVMLAHKNASTGVANWDKNLRSAVIRILDGKTGNEIRAIAPNPSPDGFMSLALGDVDGDGDAEIVMPDVGGGVTVLRNDGSVLWRRSGLDFTAMVAGAATLADLDADGHTEIIVGPYVLDYLGNLLWTMSGYQGRPFAGSPGVPSVVDLDGDGRLEVIAGAQAYRYDGSTLWRNTLAQDGLTGVANVLGDASPEVVVVHSNTVFLLSSTGQKLWQLGLPGSGAGGAPTMADMDGDGELEIGVAAGNRYSVINANGTFLWTSTTADLSSQITGSTVFDLDGDGEVEIFYNDEQKFRIYRGRDGKILFETLSTSGTHLEMPVVANIDDDPAAEVLVPSNQYMNFFNRRADPSTHGLRAFESASGSWMPTRRIWNQHAYHIENINDDGTVPRQSTPSWQTHNTWRLNTFLERNPAGQADLALFDLRLDPMSPGTVLLTARNRGLAPTETTTVVRVYNGSSAAGKLLGTWKLPSLASGEDRALRLDNVDLAALGDSLYAVIDEIGAVPECLENNNGIRARVFRMRVTDQGELYDQQVFSVGVLDVNDAPTFQAVTLPTPRIGQKFRFAVKATDPDLGDAITYRIENAPAGMSIEPVSGEVRWTPLATQAGLSSFTVRATDLRGATIAATYSVTLPANAAPVVDSSPIVEAMAGQPYEYDVQASDPDGDLLSYLFDAAPAGMTIDANNGMVRWTPGEEHVGNASVVVRVIDANGGATTQAWTIAVAPPANHAPEFDSSPLTTVALGQRYDYDSAATDLDGDALRYELLEAPAGMAVDTVTGRVVWQPRTDQIGVHAIRLQVNDGKGGLAVQQFEVLVAAGIDRGNHPPTISSVPETFALIGTTYAYDVSASDLDGDTLHYELSAAPSGMSIDAANGKLRWTPSSAQAGLNTVVVEVSDGRGGSSKQSFGVLASTVPGGSGNHPPAITSDPLTLVTLGQTYRYYIAARDPDGDALSYSLAQAPAGMGIDPMTGVVAWTPQALGAANVSVRVSDGRGGTSTQSFTVTTVVSDSQIDHRPVVTGMPATSAKVGVTYEMSLQAVDADGDPMQFHLLEGPAGAAVNPDTGLVTWTPAAEGSVRFTVRIVSGDGYTDVSWTVSVVSAETPLTVHVVANPERVAPGGAYVAGMEYAGSGGPIRIDATLNGEPLALDADGQTALVAPSTPGHYLLAVTIDDGHSTASDSADLFVSDPSDTTAPSVSISSPAIDARVTAPTPVFGEVAGGDVARWTLSLLDKATGATTPIATGDSAAGPGVLGTLDPTLASNGFYALVLQAWDASGNQAQASRTVLIDGEMKLGHFSLSFEDVSLPMAGMPIRVTRTYDTRRRNERLDFGFGWSVDYQNIRLTESRAPGYSWTLVSERNGFFGNWCVRPNGDPIVAVTAPDGKLLKFRAKAMPECQFAAPQPDVQIVFEALPGTDAQLSQTDYGIVRLTQVAGSGVYNLLDMGDTSQSPANPSHYRLKLPDGTIYSITQGVGLTQVSEPDGNTLTYSAGGIKHSRGQEIAFLRDGQNRIEQIVLPDGRRRRYTYTPAGDLEIAVDTGADLTSFAYLPQAPHYLRDIIDPRGVRVSRNEYDDNGRLVATIDADNHRIEYTHNLDGRVETIRDRRGNASTYAYDSEGRVTAESNALGETTLHSYDANGNELTTTDPLNHVTRRTFDARGNLLTETNPLSQKVTRTYDGHNNLLTQVDALGRTVASNAYHAYNGKLVLTQDALGNVTTFGYDSGLGSGGTGDLTGIVDAANGTTRYELNFFGHRFREIDAAGNQTDFELDTTGRVHGEYKRRTRDDGVSEVLWTHYTLDDKDRITATRHPDGSTTTVEYDGNGKPVKSCDALGRCTLQSYNLRGELERTTYPDGTYEESTYDANGNVEARRDRGGRMTVMKYDEANRLVETILPDATPADLSDNPRTANKYDAAGRMVMSTDERGYSTSYGYDDANRRIWVKDALSHVTTTEYDAAGQRTAVTDALGHRTCFIYDLAGRLTETIHPDDTPASLADNPRTGTEYDALGRKTAEIDELGRRKQYDYDALGRLVAVTLPNPATGLIDGSELITRYAYDEVGNRIRQIDALGRVTRWEYDTMGRQVRRTLPLGQSESMQYDVAGQLIAKTDFNGVTTRYSYDVAGRLAGTDYAHDADVITTYTASGQRESVTDGQGTTLYRYDARDRLVHVQYPDGNAIAYGYDAAGNRTALHSPAQDQAFEFDELNRLWKVRTRVLGGAERVVTYGYDAVGNRTALTQADGTNTATSFDSRNRLRQLLTHTAAGVLLFGATYDVDATGARTGIAEFDANGPTRSVGYSFDSVKRLGAEVISRPGQSNHATGYTYDAVGNRLAKTEAGTLTSYAVDDNDRLLSESTAGATTLYTYDENGNITGQTKSSSWTQYTFDDQDRLVRTKDSTGLDVATGYGAEGVRNREATNGYVKSWLIDANRDYAQSLEAYVAEQPTTTWAFGDGLLSQVGISGGELHERNLSADGTGSVRQATDSGGHVTDAFEYDAFGNTLVRSGVSDIDHRYRGEQVDLSTGYYNLRARWYKATTGRFASMDVWPGRPCSPGSLNKFVYADSDPVNNLDPSGYATAAESTVSIDIQGSLGNTANPLIRRAFKRYGCELGLALGEQAITEGIYIMFDGAGFYVGQSNDIRRRELEHMNEATKDIAKAWKSKMRVVAKFGVGDGAGRDALRVMEQMVIDVLKLDELDVRNPINAINKKRGRLRGQLREFSEKICK